MMYNGNTRGDRLRVTAAVDAFDQSLAVGDVVTYYADCTVADTIDVRNSGNDLIHTVPRSYVEPVAVSEYADRTAGPLPARNENESRDSAVDALNQRILDLEARVELQKTQLAAADGMYQAAQARTATALNNHREDMVAISERLCELADEENWCSEFDDRLEEFSEEKLHGTLTSRYRDYTVKVTFEQEINVRARDEDSAVEEARESGEYGDVGTYDETEAQAEEA
jgi:hypothetical protein